MYEVRKSPAGWTAGCEIEDKILHRTVWKALEDFDNEGDAMRHLEILKNIAEAGR